MHSIKLSNEIKFLGADNQSVLDAALSNELFFPYSCKTGRCNSCKCRLLSGDTRIMMEEAGLDDIEKQQGWILACSRAAVSDIVLDNVEAYPFKLPTQKILPCRISNIDHLSDEIIKVSLKLPPSQSFDYMAGQYIDLIRGNIRRSYSIANGSLCNHSLELHIKRFESGEMSKYWFEEAKANDLLRLHGPQGTFFLRNFSGKDLIFLSTGTGFAPVNAMLESLASVDVRDRPKSVKVYWGGRIASDFYCVAPEIGYPYLFKRVFSRGQGEINDAHGYVQAACLADSPNLENAQVFACGSNAMIEDAKNLLCNAGLKAADFYSDAFVCSAFKL